MSKASAWAERLKIASDAVVSIMAERMQPSPEFYISGVGKIAFAVSTDGYPMIRIDGKLHESRWADDNIKIVEAARWIIDTFGEENT